MYVLMPKKWTGASVKLYLGSDLRLALIIHCRRLFSVTDLGITLAVSIAAGRVFQ